MLQLLWQQRLSEAEGLSCKQRGNYESQGLSVQPAAHNMPVNTPESGPESTARVSYRLTAVRAGEKRNKLLACPSCALKTVCVCLCYVCVINRAERRPRNVTQVVRNMVLVTSRLRALHQEVFLSLFPSDGYCAALYGLI